MKIQTLILTAVACVAAGNATFAGSYDNIGLEADKAYLRSRNCGLLPFAGETTGAYQNRVNQYRARQKMLGDLQSSRATLDSLKVQARKLELQIQTGMLIPDDKGATNTSPTSLTDDQKGAMLKDLLKVQENIVSTTSVVRDLTEAVAEDDARIESENVRQEIRNAQSRQTEELRREIRDEYDGRGRR
jgi:hypothetical protein